jgi:hypothetical protein
MGRISWWYQGALLFITRIDHRGKLRLFFLYSLAACIMTITRKILGEEIECRQRETGGQCTGPRNAPGSCSITRPLCQAMDSCSRRSLRTRRRPIT